MSGFLLDTNVISEFARRDNKPDPQVKAWLEAAVPESLYVSVLTLGEIRRGIEKLQAGSRRTLLENWLVKDLREWFENRLLVIDEAVANRCSTSKWHSIVCGRRPHIRDCFGTQPDCGHQE